jgi:membrane protein DedA with SNARE-associated domain
MIEILANYFQQILDYMVLLIDKIGYLGIFIGMFLESSFFPMPSEIFIIPAGVGAAYGKFNLYLVILTGVLGSIFGALFNYWIAVTFGRPVLFKIGKYFFIKEETIIKIENYFYKHGAISTFVGRLIPGVRQYISLPAGIARMNLIIFCTYTALGSAIWVSILAYLGFAIGENKELIKEYLHIAIIFCLAFCFVLAAIYYVIYKRKLARNKNN